MGINRLKKIYNIFKTFFRKSFKTNLNKYDSYDAYIKHQKIKTTDQNRIKKWLNEEWEIKYNGFIEIFSRNN